MRKYIHMFGEFLTRKSASPMETSVQNAVLKAFTDSGLPAEEFSDSYDLVFVGKLTQVYHLAAKNLGIDPEFRTVGDVIKWLKS